MDTTENVVSLGIVHEEKKDKRKPKKRKMKQALSVALDLSGGISDQNKETEDENFASQTQNSVIELNTRNQALEGTEMCDSAQEGDLVSKSSPVRIVDSVIPGDRSIEPSIPSDRPNDGKNRKLKKRKRNVNSDLSSNCQVGLLLKSSPVNDTSHQEGTEMPISERVVTANYKDDTSGLSNMVSSRNDNLETIAAGTSTTTLISVDSCLKVETDDSIQTLMLDVNSQVMLRCENGITKSSNSRDTVLPHILEGNSSIGENVRQDENIVAVIEHTHVENVKKSDEMPRSIDSEDLINLGTLTENSDCKKNVCSLFDVATEQEILTPGSYSCKKKGKRKKKKHANSQLEEHKEGERLPNQIVKASSIGDTDYALALPAEGIVSVAVESTHAGDKPEHRADTENADDKRIKITAFVIDIVKPSRHSEGYPKATKELDATDSHMQSITNNEDSRSLQNQFSDNICKIEHVFDIRKNDCSSENVVTATDVSVTDMQNLGTCKEKKKKKKRNLSSMSQMELNEEDAARDSTTDPSSLNDMSFEQSGEGTIVATGEDLQLGDNQLDDMSVLNNNTKKAKMQELHESAGGCEDQQSLRVDLNNESLCNPHQSELVTWDLNSSPKNSSKTSTTSEDICDQNLTVVQEEIVGIPCMITAKMTPDMSLQNTSIASLVQDRDIRSSLSSDSVKDVCDFMSDNEALHEKISHPSLERNCLGSPNRKLLILDINGLLADIVSPVRSVYKPDIMVSQKAVFRRPFCESFLQFCFEKFDVGVWSSRVKKNVDKVLDFLMGQLKNKLIFYWDRSHCTITGFPTVENRDKPLVLKELKKLWEKHQSHFSWEKGKYDHSNTLLLDDSPYKALCNPADTAIFPLSYQYTDVNDCSLGPGGELRVYLERLAMADNIRDYVRNNPFGQRPIRETNLSWKYYKKVLSALPPQPNR
ncbi:hypothetical protein QQ045_011420 [Rhodiola kirilowii]